MVRIEKIGTACRGEALDLALRVFMEFEAPDYNPEGVESFRNYIGNPENTDALEIYGAFEEKRLVGMGATRNVGAHISLLFVDPSFHNKGIGKELVMTMVRDCGASSMTVNSSPYAVEIYKRMGFEPTDVELVSQGIRHTPMKLDIHTRRTGAFGQNPVV